MSHLRVTVVALNHGDSTVQFEGGMGCTSDVALYRAGRPDTAPAWSWNAWQPDTLPASGGERICSTTLELWRVPPATTVELARREVPIGAILGDSLPPGRYRVEVMVRELGLIAPGTPLDAGEIELEPQ